MLRPPYGRAIPSLAVLVEFFRDGFPARTTVVAPPPRPEVNVAIEAVAYITSSE